MREGSQVWLCASEVYLTHSDVIPGHSVVHQDKLRPVTVSMTPPQWCERILEQTILEPNEKVNIEPDKRLVFDGNKVAEYTDAGGQSWRRYKKWVLKPSLW